MSYVLSELCLKIIHNEVENPLNLDPSKGLELLPSNMLIFNLFLVILSLFLL